MDIVKFAESFMNVELKDWQKDHIRRLYEMSKDDVVRIVMPKNAGRSQMYVYIDQIKELISNGATNDCKQ